MGRYRSLQSIMLAEALKGITDNQTITAYKKDCKLFAAYCKEQGVKRPDQLQGKEKELLQGYEKQLEASGYSPATIHRRLAAPCKATNISMSEIEKPKRTSGKITRSRNEKANRQGKREIEDERYSRLVTFQRAVGIRRAELSRLTGADLVIDEKGYLCVYVERGKGGKTQLQRILPEDEKVVLEMFQSVNPDQKLFSLEEMNNKIDLHAMVSRSSFCVRKVQDMARNNGFELKVPSEAGANLVIDEADRKVREVIEKYDGDPKFTGSTGGHYVSIKMNANGRFLDSLEAKYADETVEDVTITTLSKKEYTKMQQKTAEEAENEGVEVTEVGNLGINAKSTNNGSPAAKYAKAYSERMSTVNPEFE